MNKLKNDFGVRALLATMALVAYEVMLFLLIVFMWKTKALTAETAMTIAALAQSPAMMALTFYFAKANQSTQVK